MNVPNTVYSNAAFFCISKFRRTLCASFAHLSSAYSKHLDKFVLIDTRHKFTNLVVRFRKDESRKTSRATLKAVIEDQPIYAMLGRNGFVDTRIETSWSKLADQALMQRSEGIGGTHHALPDVSLLYFVTS